ncbi:MAG: dihydroorotase [Peptococcaceae bacterium]|jgi:dihydroorotase|nr:dihydroorotase [Peptococcaceae bacterium]MBQ2370047.1 dihydroorotase [Peptococcaceae bacterium]MBQ5615126.1 dihydroorotase [Peptococcaceae bacterium]MBQ5668530.1 dihydroorotase [Peptococcaceae bacterium]MBQ5708057.1 dihydroorotase [Peptococcaceae bacterium]
MTKNTSVNVVSASLASDVVDSIQTSISTSDFSAIDFSRCVVLPGFCDVHVHLREPGFSYKETIASGSLASARGGYTAVCSMPNLNPVPDSVEHLKAQQDIIDDSACIHVYPFASITVGQKGEVLSDLDGMAPNTIGFSDDGKGVQSTELMRDAMLKAKALGKPIVAHCEVNELLRGGYIHDGAYAKAHGHRGICSESEWMHVARDIELVKEIGVKYHVCHISTKETVDLIRKAKAEGVDITCETGPHYLVMDDSMLEEHGRFKMNPPLRSKEDREALVAGILDGTIDMIATDHAPHSAEEKGKGLEGSAFGVVGIETAFPILYTYLVKPGILSMERLIELMVINPRKRFDLPFGCDYSIWDLDEAYTVDPNEFISLGKATPFEGWNVNGRCLATVCDGKLIYKQ